MFIHESEKQHCLLLGIIILAAAVVVEVVVAVAIAGAGALAISVSVTTAISLRLSLLPFYCYCFDTSAVAIAGGIGCWQQYGNTRLWNCYQLGIVLVLQGFLQLVFLWQHKFIGVHVVCLIDQN